jgi:tetratricopeptide (TPR) repeat protein
MPKVIKKRTIKKTSFDDADVKGIATEMWGNIQNAFNEKRREFTIGGAIIIGVAVIAMVTMAYSSSMKSKAYDIEVNAYNVYYSDQPGLSVESRWKQSLDLFQDAVDIKASPSSLFYLGNSHFNIGDYENAIQAYNRFIDEFGSKDEITPLVYQKLAAAYFRAGNNNDAVSTLNKLAEVSGGIFRDTAHVLEARHYASIGNNDMALAKYEEIANGFPGSLWAAEAEAKVAAANQVEAPAMELGSEETAPEAAISVEPVSEVPAVEEEAAEKPAAE